MANEPQSSAKPPRGNGQVVSNSTLVGHPVLFDATQVHVGHMNLAIFGDWGYVPTVADGAASDPASLLNKNGICTANSGSLDLENNAIGGQPALDIAEFGGDTPALFFGYVLTTTADDVGKLAVADNIAERRAE